MRGVRLIQLLALSCSAASFGCSGLLDVPTGPASAETDESGSSALCGAGSVPEQPLRRLSSTQYHNTMVDLFGAELSKRVLQGSMFPATVIKAGFSGDAEANVVNTSESHAIEDNAEQIAVEISKDPEPFLRALLPCALPTSLADADISSCMDKFIDTFGERAYRRPITAEEHTIVRGLFDAIAKTQGAKLGWTSTLQFFVQSPALLYRVERGMGEPAAGLIQLSDYEIAARLSYLFTDSMPDEELRKAARDQKLRTREQITAHAKRLMDSPRFFDVLGAFHRDWLHLYELEAAAKDPAAFPEFTPELKQSMLRETNEYVRYVLEEADGSLRTLLSGTTLPVDSQLAPVYGVEAPTAAGFTPVEMLKRRGLLTQASFMTTMAKTDRTNPIHRGAFFLREVLCKKLPTLPGNVDLQGPLTSSAGMPTARERFAPLLEDSACSGCHTLFNPTGLAFEQFDAMGRFRTEENGEKIDTKGAIDLGQGMKSFDSALALIDLVADSQIAQDCYSLQWFRASLGRREAAEDACTLETLNQAAVDSKGDIRELLLALTRSDAFLFRAVSEEAP